MSAAILSPLSSIQGETCNSGPALQGTALVIGSGRACDPTRANESQEYICIGVGFKMAKREDVSSSGTHQIRSLEGFPLRKT